MCRLEMCITIDAARRRAAPDSRQRLAGQQVHRDRVGGKRVEHDQVVALRRCRKRQPRVAEHDRRSRGAQRERKRNSCGSRARRTTSGSISKKVQVSPSRWWQARLPVPSPTTATLREPALRRARGRDALRDRPAEIVVGQRLGPAGGRRAVRSRTRSAPWKRGAVIQQAMRPSAVSTTWCTPKKLRVVSITAASPGCQSAVTTKASTASAEKRAARCAATASGRRARRARPGTAARPLPAAAMSNMSGASDRERREREHRTGVAQECGASRLRTRPAARAAPRRSGSDIRRCG